MVVVRGRWGHGQPSWSTRVTSEVTKEAPKRASDNEFESLISWRGVFSDEVLEACDVTTLLFVCR